MADNVEIVLPEEVWMTIPNYANYQVSSFGRVKSLKKTWFWGRYKTPRTEPEKVLKTHPSPNGYPMAVLCKEGKGINYNTLANKLSGYHKTNKTGMVFA